MSQHPHDEFDDIPPYQSGEAGKHRAQGPTGAGAGRSGGLKWIALLAAVVLVVGLFSWLVFGDDDAETTAGEGEDGVTEEQEPAEGQDGDAEEGGEAEEGEGDAGDGDGEAQNGEQDAADEDGEVDMSTPVQIYNHNGPEGTAANAQSQIEQQGYNVTALNNWDASWGEQTTPVIYYPAGQEEFAQQLASDMGVDTVQESGSFSTVAVVVGAEYGPGQ